jgi:hypothetical protein
MKKIGIIGTANAGKTTLCYEILAALKKAHIKCDGVLQQDCRLGFDRSLLDTNHLAQWSIICNQIKAEADMGMRTDIDILVCDRSPLDLYVYYAHCFGGLSSLHKTVEDWCRITYTKLYMLRPVPYEYSTARCTEEFRDLIDKKMYAICSHYSGNIELEPVIPNMILLDKENTKMLPKWREHVINEVLDGFR